MIELTTPPTQFPSFFYIIPIALPLPSHNIPNLPLALSLIHSLFLLSKIFCNPQSESTQSPKIFSLCPVVQGLKMTRVEKEDLGLSLSLSFPHNAPIHFHLNLVSSSPSGCNPQKPSWINDPFTSSGRDSETCKGDRGSFLRGIDVNRLPSGVDCEDEAGVSSPNSTVSRVSGKRSEREPNGEENDMDRSFSRGISDEEDAETTRKKLRLSKDQSAILEDSFKEHNTLNPKQKLALAKKLGLRSRQVEVWFQNRRARTKLKQTEVDCELLKRCCENLTEENRRLQKEVQELRALKLSPQFYMHMTPPTTLTMCPSCERVAVPSSAVDVATRHHPMPPTHARPISVVPWATAAAGATPQRTFDVFRPRS